MLFGKRWLNAQQSTHRERDARFSRGSCLPIAVAAAAAAVVFVVVVVVVFVGGNVAVLVVAAAVVLPLDVADCSMIFGAQKRSGSSGV